MSDLVPSAGVQLKVDYDVGRWVMIPPAEVSDAESWATRTIGIWERDGAWKPSRRERRVLQDWFVELAEQSRALEARIGYVHIRPGLPTPLLGVDLFLHLVTDQDAPSIAESVVGEPSPTVRRSDPVAVSVGAGPDAFEGRRWTTATDGTVGGEYRLAWQAHPLARLMLRATTPDLPRLEVAIDDIRALARVAWLEPLEEQL